jgi:hypothetical protein
MTQNRFLRKCKEDSNFHVYDHISIYVGIEEASQCFLNLVFLYLLKGLFIWAKVIPVNERTFRLAKYFCSVHMEKLYPAYRVKFSAVTCTEHQLN